MCNPVSGGDKKELGEIMALAESELDSGSSAEGAGVAASASKFSVSVFQIKNRK